MSKGRMIFASIVIIFAVAAGAGVLLLLRPRGTEVAVNPPIPTATPFPTSTPFPMLIYVTGAVVNPQTRVSVPHGSRVSDVIEVAGGATEQADLDRVNLAAIVRDGDQIHIPAKAETQNMSLEEDSAQAAPAEPPPLATPSGGTRIYVNSATLAELESLPRIGPALAQRIIDYRTQNGPFATLDDLEKVSGIGEAIINDIADLISFD